MSSKKQRKPNFSDLEVEVLVDAVSINYSILYGKFSSSLTNARKTATWQQVTDKVNAVSLQCTRDVVEVKKKWQDLQSAAKKKEAERRKKMMKTGGGPLDHPSMNLWEEKVLQVIPSTAISGISGGTDTSETTTSSSVQNTSMCTASGDGSIEGLIITEVPVEELVSQATGTTCNDTDKATEVEETNSVAPMSTSRGKRGYSCSEETRRLLDFEEEKLKIKKRHLEIEEEKLQVLKNIHNLLQENCSNPIYGLISKEM
ncbi:LOW QUALITY PROTEIN: nuclear apoptosis-inducing factor 1-like [Ostrea edulis]|uniref:LOW QUALITY PROTEIN: nuclear apoptosis-inducing factor 1-like n=1 Tax=Ostrea edulis TaxID=37623 RepID=UPI0024AFD48F|nr:LOW QUALITY PROTEIN: nuclear apoptosis-inducing factor 1-like [Ostrea edulis]